MSGKGIKGWNTTFAPLPDNYELIGNEVPPELDFDLVLSQHKFGQFQLLAPIAKRYQIPLISLEHTLPVPGWPKARLNDCRAMSGDRNVFISEMSRDAWGWGEAADVIHHGIDTEMFSPDDGERHPYALSVVNDWVNRDWCCGYRFWQEATQGIPTYVVGDTPGLSLPAYTTDELVQRYRRSMVFVNTSLVSPVPTALLEAMSCGCAVVSTDTCMIPDIIQDGENGLLAATPEEMRGHLRCLLADPAECLRLGRNARKTIEERFGMDTFVENWKKLFRETAGREN